MLVPSLFCGHYSSSYSASCSYASPPYARLAYRAQSLWRNTPGLKDTYTESGLILVANYDTPAETYVRESYENVLSLNRAAGELEGAVTKLPTKKDIAAAVKTCTGSGDLGYINRDSGWADAEAAMRWLRTQVEATGRVTFKHGTATSLLRSAPSTSSRPIINGALLSSGEKLFAELVIVAAGAWTPSLIDLRGRATATGQVLAYLDLTEEEQQKLQDMPVLLNMSTGMFVIPPKGRVLKIARHGFGYQNPVEIACPLPCSPSLSAAPSNVTICLPRTTHDNPEICIPPEGADACQDFLYSMIPSLAGRQFSNSRICWYTDTPEGDFLITYHPAYDGLFMATGGSGHGFKFLPVIGDAIVDCVECGESWEDVAVVGKVVDAELRKKWAWPRTAVEGGIVITEDGSRGGRRDMVLDEELRKRVVNKGSKL